MRHTPPKNRDRHPEPLPAAGIFCIFSRSLPIAALILGPNDARDVELTHETMSAVHLRHGGVVGVTAPPAGFGGHMAVQLTNNASDAGQLPGEGLLAVHASLEQRPRPALAATGNRSEQAFRGLDGCGTELVALGREGKHPLSCDRQRNPRTAKKWPTDSTARRVRRPTRDENGLPRRPTAGSRTCWDYDSSACGAWSAATRTGGSSVWR